MQIILESVRHSSLQFIGKPNVRKQAILNLGWLNKMLGSRCIFPIRHILCTEKVVQISNRYIFHSFITRNTYAPNTQGQGPYKNTTYIMPLFRCNIIPLHDISKIIISTFFNYQASETNQSFFWPAFCFLWYAGPLEGLKIQVCQL